MFKFVLTRLGILLVSLFIFSFIIFLLLNLLPGDIALIIGGKNATLERIQNLRTNLGLDKPLITRYFNVMTNLFGFNLGVSPLTGQSIASSILSSLSLTIPLVCFGLLVSLILVFSINYFQKAFYFVQFLSYTPTLVISFVLLVMVGKGIGFFQIFPSIFDKNNFLYSLVLPSIILAIAFSGNILRVVQSEFRKNRNSNYVCFAKSKGLSNFAIETKHILRVSSSSIIQIVMLEFSASLTGVVVIEKLFNIRGLGTNIVNDILSRDLVKLQYELLVLTTIILIVGAVIDIISLIFDPRLRSEDE